MGIEEEQVHTVEPGAPDLCAGGESQHGVEIDGWLRIRPFADESGPHGVVKFWIWSA
jgi:hypothetical protein